MLFGLFRKYWSLNLTINPSLRTSPTTSDGCCTASTFIPFSLSNNNLTNTDDHGICELQWGILENWTEDFSLNYFNDLTLCLGYQNNSTESYPSRLVLKLWVTKVLHMWRVNKSDTAIYLSIITIMHSYMYHVSMESKCCETDWGSYWTLIEYVIMKYVYFSEVF